MKKPIIPGTKFGRWTVLHRIPGLTKSGHAKYLCKCSCGTVKDVLAYKMFRKASLSCGCLRLERKRKQLTTHDLSQHPLYTVHYSMMRRCYNKTDPAYRNYGNRGIKVCKRWHNIINFIEDNKLKFNESLTMDRIDNNKSYSPDNIHWVTRRTQAMNRRNNVIITFNGKSQPLFQWAYDVGIKPRTLWARIKQLNWSVERAITTPIQKH